MKLATFNVNGINERLPVLLRWLEDTMPDVVCLQELKAAQDDFPLFAVEKAGYGAIWNGQENWNGVAILARGRQLEATHAELPGEPDISHSRYIETTIDGYVIGCVYVPKGNPAPGPAFDSKLAWFDRLIKYAQALVDLDAPVILAGNFNVIPSDLDAYQPQLWAKDALFLPESRAAFRTLLRQGWTDAIRKLHPAGAIYTFWDFYRDSYVRNAGLRIDHLLLNPRVTNKLVKGGVDDEVRGWQKPSEHAPAWIQLRTNAG